MKMVQFFDESVVCEHCGNDTRGEVYENSAMIICSVCDGVMLDCGGLDNSNLYILELEHSGTVH